jgi:putative phage-type endonuclease
MDVDTSIELFIDTIDTNVIDTNVIDTIDTIDTNVIDTMVDSMIVTISDTMVAVVDSIKNIKNLTPRDEIEIIETAFSLIKDLISSDPMIYIQPNFHDYVVNEVTELILLEPIVEEEEISVCIEKAMDLFYKQVAPRRSYTTSYIRIKPNITEISNKMAYLKNIPQPDQRTPEWYSFRYKFLTASSIWKAFISESTRNQLIYDKCKPLNLEKYNHTSTDSPMHWGHKYEPVSIQLYELMYKTKVSDFGCLPHDRLKFIAASPDGINTQDTSDRYGRMLEVKNIVNRDIDGNPKMEYWIQMQLQMEVCDLNECDFLETRFKEYENEEAYLEDSYLEYLYFDNEKDVNKTKKGQQKGMMIMFIVNGKPQYEYAPLNASIQQRQQWEEEVMNLHANDEWCKNIYWWLDELSCVLVLRNKLWFNAAIPILNELWKTIEYEKNSGYEHRSPKKKVKVIKNQSSESLYTGLSINTGSLYTGSSNTGSLYTGSLYTGCQFNLNDIEMS